MAAGGNGAGFMARAILAIAAVVAVVAALAGATALPSQAARLDVADCKRLSEEQTTLRSSGVADDLAKGPDWAKDNLAPERLRQIERFLHVSEVLQFRCPEVIAAAAVRKLEEQARLRAAAEMERQRRWEENFKRISPPERNPTTRVAARANDPDPVPADGRPPLPVRKSR